MMMMKEMAAPLIRRMRAIPKGERRGKRGRPKGSEAARGRANL
jgi:hypothetical protein